MFTLRLKPVFCVFCLITGWGMSIILYIDIPNILTLAKARQQETMANQNMIISQKATYKNITAQNCSVMLVFSIC